MEVVSGRTGVATYQEKQSLTHQVQKLDKTQHDKVS